MKLYWYREKGIIMANSRRYPDDEYRRDRRRQSGKKRSKTEGSASSKKRQQAAIQQKRKKKRRRKRRMPTSTKIFLGICIALLILVLCAIGFLASKMSKLKTVNIDPDELSISDELTYDETGYLNVALFGLDTRKNNDEMGSRSDTIMIASLNRETKEVRISSVFRDTLLQQDDGTFNKANSAYNFGGPEEAIAMLNRNLDMDIQHYVTVDFSALVDVIDELGGVEIDVTEEEIQWLNGYSVEIQENTGVETWAVEKPGLQNLTGVQATAYARIRYTQGDDYKRAERQRTVLAKIAEKAQGANLSTISKIIDKVFPKVETNFKLREVLAYAKDIKKFKLCETVGFPFDKNTMIFGDAGDSVIPDNLVDNVRQLHEYFFGSEGDYVYTPSSTVQEINNELVYATGIGSAYSDAGTYSTDAGAGEEYSSQEMYSSDSGVTEEYSEPAADSGEYTDTTYGNETGTGEEEITY